MLKEGGVSLSSINKDYIEDYIRSITPSNEGKLLELERYGIKNNIPIIDKEVGQLIKLLLKMRRPKNILEIGTAIGYSSILMAENSPKDTRITTIERYEKNYDIAMENIKKFGYDDKIDVRLGDANEVLLNLKDKYDFVFIDAAKGQYLEFFNKTKDLLSDDALIISDNVLFKGMVATDDLVVRRKKTIVKRLREYLEYINNLEGFTTAVLSISDGVALTYNKE